MLDRFISLFAPHTCVACGREGSLLCLWCSNDAFDELPQRCYQCSVLSVDSKVCAKCRRTSPLSHVWIRTQYAETARELVYALKFARAQASARIIAQRLDEAVPYLPGNTVITYIPTATSRVRIRGYDQARLIAVEFASLRKLPCQRLLIRIGQTRQVRSSRAQRALQATKNYLPISKDITYRDVVLIDDILTTGATLEAAAKVLKGAGVKNVYGAIFAQKQ